MPRARRNIPSSSSSDFTDDERLDKVHYTNSDSGMPIDTKHQRRGSKSAKPRQNAEFGQSTCSPLRQSEASARKTINTANAFSSLTLDNSKKRNSKLMGIQSRSKAVKSNGNAKREMSSGPQYKEISKCIVCCDPKLIKTEESASKCKCKNIENDCSQDDCLNRALRYECSTKCPNGENCKNRRFQNLNYARIELFKTEYKGYGVKAAEPINKGTFIIEYVGEIIDSTQVGERGYKPTDEQTYLMELQRKIYIDATRKGNMSRFINHSCDPNAEPQRWTVKRRARYGFFARRNIKVGEEITFDYGFEILDGQSKKCYCGSADCRGVIGAKK